MSLKISLQLKRNKNIKTEANKAVIKKAKILSLNGKKSHYMNFLIDMTNFRFVSFCFV